MNYPDTDTTQTNWSEYRQRNQTEPCPITGATTSLGYMPAKYADATLDVSHTVHGGRSKSKRQAMFDKFLYQK